MHEAVLEQLGFTKGEIKVYLALNRFGESTVGPIGRKSGVSKSKLYEILDRLIAKGLAGYVFKEGTKYFSASSPAMILDYIDEREEELRTIKALFSKEVLPSLVQAQGSLEHTRAAEVFEGIRGVQGIREELMKSLRAGDTLLVLGAPKAANEKWEGWFLDFHARRIRRRVGLKIIYNADAHEYGAIRSKMPLTQVRYFDKLISPNWIDIYPRAVLFVAVLQVPVGFLIRDAGFADSFRAYFEILWRGTAT